MTISSNKYIAPRNVAIADICPQITTTDTCGVFEHGRFSQQYTYKHDKQAFVKIPRAQNCEKQTLSSMSVSAPCLSLSSIRAAKSASASTVAEHRNRKQQRYSRWVGRFVRTAVALCMSIEGYLRNPTKKYISTRLYITQMRFHAVAPNLGILDEGENQQTLTAD